MTIDSDFTKKAFKCLDFSRLIKYFGIYYDEIKQSWCMNPLTSNENDISQSILIERFQWFKSAVDSALGLDVYYNLKEMEKDEMEMDKANSSDHGSIENEIDSQDSMNDFIETADIESEDYGNEKDIENTINNKEGEEESESSFKELKLKNIPSLSKRNRNIISSSDNENENNSHDSHDDGKFDSELKLEPINQLTN